MKASILLLTILGMITINFVTGGPIEDPKHEASSENVIKNADVSDVDVLSRRKRSSDYDGNMDYGEYPNQYGNYEDEENYGDYNYGDVYDEYVYHDETYDHRDYGDEPMYYGDAFQEY